MVRTYNDGEVLFCYISTRQVSDLAISSQSEAIKPVDTRVSRELCGANGSRQTKI